MMPAWLSIDSLRTKSITTDSSAQASGDAMDSKPVESTPTTRGRTNRLLITRAIYRSRPAELRQITALVKQQIR